MFAMAPTLSDPKASYEVTGDNLYKNQRPGTRGYAGRPDTATTVLAGLNNDLVISTKAPRPKIGAVKVQYGVIGPNAPVALYEHGTPATLKLPVNQGYQLAATFPGVKGSLMSLTIIDPGGVASPLVVKAVPTGQIVVYLGRAASVVTTTATLLVDAINRTPGVSRWVRAWVSDPALVAPLTALPKTYFKGGSDVPYLVYVGVNASVAGVVATTATQVRAALAGSSLVTAVYSGADTGAGAVVAAGPLALTGGSLSAGHILYDDTSSIEMSRLENTPGQGIANPTNYTLQVAKTRQAAVRTWRTVPTEDRAVIASSDINYQKEHKPRSLFL